MMTLTAAKASTKVSYPSFSPMKLRSGALVKSNVLSVEATEALTAANALNPFLKLPQEIKNKIYVQVLGGNFVHIKKKPLANHARFTYVICCASVSEDQAQHNFDNASPYAFAVTENDDRHGPCAYKNHHQRTNVNLLHTCTQIQREAHYIAFSSNTFSFRTSRDLRGFMHHNLQHKVDLNLAIRSIHLEMGFNTNQENVVGWIETLKKMSRRAPLIEILNISIDIAQFWDMLGGVGDPETKIAIMDSVHNIPMVLKNLPLKTVTLVVNDRKLSDYSPQRQVDLRWIVGQQQEWARGVKSGLLKKSKDMAIKKGMGDLPIRTKPC